MDSLKKIVPFGEKKETQQPLAEDQNNLSQNNDDASKSMWDNFQNKAENAASIVSDKASSLKADISTSIDRKLEQVDSVTKSMVEKVKHEINIWVHDKIEKATVAALESLRPHAKKALKDEDMFECEKNWIDNIVDENWPDLVDEARFRLKMSTQVPSYPDAVKPDRNCFLVPICWLRAKYLYATMPYDQTFWKQRKNPFFWIFMALKSFPYYGVQPCMYLLIFVFIDKTDEYQLVKYILDFKKMQFLTQGAMQGVIGYLLYFNCASYFEKKDGERIGKKCVDEGPGADMNFYYDLIVYCSQVLLVWVAYISLPFSKKKGMPKFKYESQDPEAQRVEDEEKKKMCQVNCQRGGLLQSMLIWDILTFAVGTFTYIFTFKNQPIDDLNWKDSTPFLFLGKFLYGILSFPFLIFAIPVIAHLLTKSKPTAYDKYGNTVPHKTDLVLDYEKNKDRYEEEEDPLKKQKNPDVMSLFGLGKKETTTNGDTQN